MRRLGFFIWLITAITVQAAEDDWRAALAQMPLRTGVTELDTSNYVDVMLQAFGSNDTVKALIFQPGAVDTFFWHRETRVLLTNASPSLLDEVVAMTNQTRIRASFRPPLLLLHFDWDPLEPACEIWHGEAVDKIRARPFAAHVLYDDKDWDFTLPVLKKATGITIAPKLHSRYSYHFYRSSFAAWNLNAWEALETVSLATRTVFDVEKRKVTFREDDRYLTAFPQDGSQK